MRAVNGRSIQKLAIAISEARRTARSLSCHSPMPPPEQATSSPDKAAAHRVAIHVDDNDAKVMNLALNNAQDIIEYYKGKGSPLRSRS